MKKIKLSTAAIFTYCLLHTACCFSQGTAINSSGAPADNSAGLDVNFNNKGFLMPRMTTGERNAIASPAEGLQLFNTTTKCLEIYANNLWQSVFCSCTPPDTPAAGTHIPSATEIIWDWTDVSGALGYQWNTTGTYPGTGVNVVSNSTYTQTGLTCNTPYSLYVWAYNNCGKSLTGILLRDTTSAFSPTGIVGWWTFSGGASDISGYNNNGTVYGAALTTDRFGAANSAYNFNGSSDYINCGTNTILAATTSSPLTITAWILPESATAGNFISKYMNLDAGLSNYFFSYNGSTSTVTMSGNGSNTFSYNGVSPGQWVHLAGVFANGANNSKIYLNGVLKAQGTVNLNASATTTAFDFGRVEGAFPGYYLGKIDDVIIFNRVLSDAEILMLYQGCTP